MEKILAHTNRIFSAFARHNLGDCPRLGAGAVHLQFVLTKAAQLLESNRHWSPSASKRDSRIALNAHAGLDTKHVYFFDFHPEES